MAERSVAALDGLQIGCTTTGAGVGRSLFVRVGGHAILDGHAIFCRGMAGVCLWANRPRGDYYKMRSIYIYIYIYIYIIHIYIYTRIERTLDIHRDMGPRGTTGRQGQPIRRGEAIPRVGPLGALGHVGCPPHVAPT